MSQTDSVSSRRRNVLKTIVGTSTVGMLAGCSGGSSDGGSSDGGGSDGGGVTERSEEQDTFSLTLAEAANKANAHYKGSVLLADKVEEMSDGRIELNVIGSQQAGGPPEITQSVNQGTLDMGLSAVNNLANLTPAWLFVQLPYLWENHDALYSFFNDPEVDIVEEVNQRAYQDLENIEVLSYWGSGGGSMRHLHFSSDSKPVVPGDSSGEAIRVTESPIEGSTVSNWRYSASPVAWSETVSAMRQGVVSGIHIHYHWLFDSGMYEEINYTVETQTQDSPAILHVNNDSWSKLPSDLQDVMTSAIDEVTPKQHELDIETGVTAKESIMDEKGDDIEIYQPTDSELEQWQQVTEPVYNEWLGQEGVSEDFVEAALDYQDRSISGIDL